VEAAGIEPASRDISTEATTLIACLLFLVSPVSGKQDSGLTSPTVVSLA